MMKEENENSSISDRSAAAAAARFSLQVPPGFSPNACTTAAGLSRNENPNIHDENVLHAYIGTSNSRAKEAPPRNSSRKRSRPQFYLPPAPTVQKPATGLRRRGRPRKSESKSSCLAHSEKEKGSTNQIPSTPSRRLQDENGVSLTESHTALDDANVTSRSSDTDKDLVHTLKAINIKHGDITQSCLLESDCMKTSILLGICKVVQDLQRKQLKDLDISCLDSYYTVVRDAENMKVNVEWLRSRLDEIKDAFKLSDEANDLINLKNWRDSNVDKKKKELSLRKDDLQRLMYEVQDIEEQLAREVVMVNELNTKLGNHMSKISQFQHANLMDGLI